MFTFVAGSINNDTLAYLSVGLAFFGLSRFRLQPDSRDVIGFSCFAAGLIIAFLTKATVSAFLVFFLAVLAALRWRDLPALIRNPYYLWTAALITLICGGYYMYALHSFGKLFPTPAALYPKNPPANPDGLGDYGLYYVEVMWHRFPAIMKVRPIPEAMNPAFYAMAMLPLAGWLLARPRARSRGAHPLQIALGDAFVIALLATFLLNILVAYKGYLQHGLYAGWQPRYFLFAVPATWFIMTLVKPAPLIRVAILGAFAIAACISFWSSVPFVLAKHQARSAPKATPKCVPSTRLSGRIDEFKRVDGQLSARGWAFDTAAGRTPQRVWAMLDKTRLDSVAVNNPRPDVAKALCNDAANNAGFHLEIHGIPAATDPCHVDFKAELADGSLTTLKNPACRN